MADEAVADLRLNREQAADYITRRFFPITKSTLDSKAHKGTGPRYQVIGENGGGQAFYEKADLDEWARAQFRNPTTRKKQAWAERINQTA